MSDLALSVQFSGCRSAGYVLNLKNPNIMLLSETRQVLLFGYGIITEMSDSECIKYAKFLVLYCI